MRDGIIEHPTEVGVDLLVGRQENDLVAGIRKIPFDQGLSMLAIQPPQRRVDYDRYWAP